ncbi:MAG: type IV secretion system DNA-binding domain-containing protein [Acidiferrobacterales bacterium]
MSADAQSQSDINWATGERPALTAVAAGLGAVGGYVAGMQGLLWHLDQPIMPLREIPSDIFHLLLRYGPVLPVSGGWAPAACAVLAAVALGAGMWRLATRENERHMRGIRLRRNPKAAARALAPGRNEIPGIALHPAIRISMHLECKHIMLLGGAGSGKTTLLWPMLNEIVARQDRALIFDFKGDFTSSLPGSLTLLSPCDARSARWIVGADIETRLEAEALTETLIPLPAGGEGPIWARGARGLCLGLISHLQAMKPGGWDFADLAQVTSETLSNYKKLVEIIEREHPPARVYLMGRDSKTTMGFLAELAGALTHVINLGVAGAASNPKTGAWSVKGWLKDGSRLPKTVVLGFRPSSKELSQAFLASVIEQVVRQVASMSDCRPDKRRLWLILDEVPQCGRIPSISDALVTLRSKGCRVVLGLQSVAQIEQVYDRHTQTIWASSTATKIVCSVASPSDQKWASDLVGERELERYHGQSQLAPGAGAVSRSSSWHRVKEPVMMPAQFGQVLGVGRNGPRAVLLGGGTAAMLDWPFPEVKPLRKDRVDAPWIRVGYKRPAWGAAPPPVAVPDDDESEASTVTPAPMKKPPEQQQPKPAVQATAKAPVQTAPGQAQKPAPKREPEADSPDPIADMAGSTLLDAVVPGAGMISDLARQILDAAGMGESPASATMMPVEFPQSPTNESEPETNGGEYEHE